MRFKTKHIAITGSKVSLLFLLFYAIVNFLKMNVGEVFFIPALSHSNGEKKIPTSILKTGSNHITVSTFTISISINKLTL